MTAHYAQVTNAANMYKYTVTAYSPSLEEEVTVSGFVTGTGDSDGLNGALSAVTGQLENEESLLFGVEGGVIEIVPVNYYGFSVVEH